MSTHAMNHDKAAKERAKAITQRFLEGTTANTSEEAIQTGQRTLLEWCEALRPRDPPNHSTNAARESTAKAPQFWQRTATRPR